MSTALFDLIRLSAKTGKIPATIPDHYVLFAQQSHRFKKQPLRHNVIILKG